MTLILSISTYVLFAPLITLAIGFLLFTAVNRLLSSINIFPFASRNYINPSLFKKLYAQTKTEDALHHRKKQRERSSKSGRLFVDGWAGGEGD